MIYYLSAFALLLNSASAFFSSSYIGTSRNAQHLLATRLNAPTKSKEFAERTSIENYEHKDFKLSYLYKKPSPGRENDPPIILVSPVGIGLSSWFWKRVMDQYQDNPAIYAPDYIGCGINHGADPWDPKKTGLFFPLSWVEGVETLIKTIAIPRWKENKSPLSNFLGVNQKKGCLVIVQGGSAPVGIMLAKRNPLTVGSVMFTSPPTWTDITTAIPEKELKFNYEFLCSPIFGDLAFALLETRGAIRFFSNLFLFQEKCGDIWLDEAQREACFEARTPVQAFNAGLLQHRSFEDDLKESHQPKMIVSGVGDKRAVDRQAYQSELERCTLTRIEGLNVLPWERPEGIVDLIKEIGY